MEMEDIKCYIQRQGDNHVFSAPSSQPLITTTSAGLPPQLWFTTLTAEGPSWVYSIGFFPHCRISLAIKFNVGAIRSFTFKAATFPRPLIVLKARGTQSCLSGRKALRRGGRGFHLQWHMLLLMKGQHALVKRVLLQLAAAAWWRVSVI